MSEVDIKDNIIVLRKRDSHIAVGILEKMNDYGFDNEERAYFCFLEAYFLKVSGIGTG